MYNKDITAKEIKTIGGQVDIMPTLLYTLGIDESEISNTAFGKNLLKTNKNFTVLKNGEIVGVNVKENDIKHAKEGIDIADTVIRSDYYKTVLNYKKKNK